jgi:hypothetical protein
MERSFLRSYGREKRGLVALRNRRLATSIAHQGADASLDNQLFSMNAPA